MVTLLTGRGAEAHAEEMPNTPDPEVPEQAKRRRFTAADKARILTAADAAASLARSAPCCAARGCTPRT